MLTKSKRRPTRQGGFQKKLNNEFRDLKDLVTKIRSRREQNSLNRFNRFNDSHFTEMDCNTIQE